MDQVQWGNCRNSAAYFYLGKEIGREMTWRDTQSVSEALLASMQCSYTWWTRILCLVRANPQSGKLEACETFRMLFCIFGTNLPFGQLRSAIWAHSCRLVTLFNLLPNWWKDQVNGKKIRNECEWVLFLIDSWPLARCSHNQRPHPNPGILCVAPCWRTLLSIFITHIHHMFAQVNAGNNIEMTRDQRDQRRFCTSEVTLANFMALRNHHKRTNKSQASCGPVIYVPKDRDEMMGMIIRKH